MFHSRWLICLLCLAISTTVIAQEKDAAQPKGPIPPPVAIPGAGLAEWVDPYLLRPRISVRHDVGDGVGFNNGFTYLQAWNPLVQQAGRSVLFTDLRVVNFDNANYWEFNAGGGSRWYNADRDRIFGVNLYYDGRKTATTFLNQIGFGVESLGKYLDFRANGYCVLGSASQIVADDFSNPAFQGFNIALDRTLISANALSGFDTEIGTPLPFLKRWDTRAFVGYYHYAGGQDPDVNGVRGRLEAQVNDNLSLHFSAQNDAVFGTTISGGIAMHFGARNAGSAHRGTADRLDARVVRDVNVVINTTKEVKKETALDPTTGQPIKIVHANSAAAAGGDGTAEKPFNTLATLQAGSAPTNILFVHAGSEFINNKIVLQNNQRFLGGGIQHTVNTTQGSVVLPLGTGATPVIRNASGNLVTLANDNEVAGFAFASPGNASIFGSGKSNFNINRNSFLNPGVNWSSVFISNGSGTSTIANNTFLQTNSNAAAGGVTIDDATGELRLSVLNNTTSGHTFAGVFIGFMSTGNTVTATIRDNAFNDTAASQRGFAGILSQGTINLQLLRNTSTQGYTLSQSGTGAFNVLADTLTTNVGTVNQTGTINVVQPGIINFP